MLKVNLQTSNLFFLGLCFFASASFSQTTSNLIVPCQQTGNQIAFTQPEGAVSFSLQSQVRAGASWNTFNTYAANHSNPVVSLTIPSQLRNRNLRVVASVRPASGQRKNISFSLANNGKFLTFRTSASARLYSVERYQAEKKNWVRISTVASSPSPGVPVRVNLPAAPAKYNSKALRVVAVSGDPPSPPDLAHAVPAPLRSGISKFQSRQQTSSSTPASMSVQVGGLGASLRTSQDSLAATGPAIQESDIWKIRGRKIYLFNQLRGLQVLNTSNAAQPVVVGSFSLPAVGEDLYLLGPEDQSAEGALLLARLPWQANRSEGTRVIRLAFDRDSPFPQTSLDLPGTLQESRLVGSRLHLVSTSWQDERGNWSPTTWITTLDVSSPGVLVEEAQRAIPQYVSVVGTTSRYLWLAGSNPGEWARHTLTAFPIAAEGGIGDPVSIPLGGMVLDKFKVGEISGGLAAVVQSWQTPEGIWRNQTLLETYAVDTQAVPRLRARMPIVQDEWLYATRFDGDRLYAVTFRQMDPLWLIDLGNPDQPAITGHLEVPGWSSFIEPLGNLLVAVGRERGNVQVSLFDVADRANPRLASRVDVGGSGYSWSEAEWNEKAVKILPEAGLILVPVTEWSGEKTTQGVKLLGLDCLGQALSVEGTIFHNFSPRRATLLAGDLVASVSNRELLLVDVSSRSVPSVLSDVTLAFGVDRLAAVSGYLYQFENANPREGENPNAVLRVAPFSDPDGVLAEIPLSASTISAAEVVGDRLVLVESGGGGWGFWRGRGAPISGYNSVVSASVWSLQNPALPSLLGRVSLPGNQAGQVTVLPTSSGVVAITRKTGSWFSWSAGRLFPLDGARIADCGWFPCGLNTDSLAVDLVGIQASPSLVGSWNLSDGNADAITAVQAFGDLLVFGVQKRDTSPAPETVALTGAGINNSAERIVSSGFLPQLRPRLFWQSRNWLQVVDLADPSQPMAWAPVELPGALVGVSWLERVGGVVFSRSGSGDNRIFALGFDGEKASVGAELDLGDSRCLLSMENSIYSASDASVQRWDFSEGSSSFEAPIQWALPVSGIRQLEISGGKPWVLAGSSLYSLENGSTADRGTSPGWPDLGLIRSADGDTFLPSGPYGTYVPPAPPAPGSPSF